jgi:hypothetical protein
MSSRRFYIAFIALAIILLFSAYDCYVTEESFADIMDARVNSKFIHDETNDLKQVTFDVDVPLNRYYVSNVSTPDPNATTTAPIST